MHLIIRFIIKFIFERNTLYISINLSLILKLKKKGERGMGRKRGLQVSTYFESELADNLVKMSEKMEIKIQDLIRLAIRNYMENEAVIEIEKLQVFNLQAFKFLANKLAHIELVSAAIRNDSKKNIANFDEALAEVKKFNQEAINSFAEETL